MALTIALSVPVSLNHFKEDGKLRRLDSYNVYYCFGTKTWNDWPKRENWLIPCKGRHSPSFFFFLCFEKEVRESSYLAWYQPVFTFRSLVSHFGSGTISGPQYLRACALQKKINERVYLSFPAVTSTSSSAASVADSRSRTTSESSSLKLWNISSHPKTLTMGWKFSHYLCIYVLVPAKSIRNSDSKLLFDWLYIS